MPDNGESRNVNNQSSVGTEGGNNVIHTGSGRQDVRFGGPWAQAVALVAVLVGVVVGTVMMPTGSGGQHSLYVVVLILCALACGSCLWSACNGVRKKPTAFTWLIAVPVVSAALAAGQYMLLDAHGDLTTTTDVQSKPLADGGRTKVTIDSADARTHVRIHVMLPDQSSTSMCFMDTTVSLVPVVGGSPLGSEKITLKNDKTGDIDLHNPQKHIELTALIDAGPDGKNCLTNLQIESAVMHDDAWWLL